MNKKILIIEDEEITALAMETLLTNLGYLVIGTVNNSQDALNIVKKTKPNLILSDIMIKGNVSGCEVTHMIHKDYNIPIIFISAYFDNEIFEYAKNANPYGYIIKPYKNKELEAVVKLAFHKISVENKENKKMLDNNMIFFDDYKFDCNLKKVFKDTKYISLNNKSIKILELLLKNKNNIVSYEVLLLALYDTSDNEVSLDNLRHIIQRMKKKFQLKSIKSVKNIGYILEN